MIGHLVRTRFKLGTVTQTAYAFVEGDAAALVREIVGLHHEGIEQVVEVITDEGTSRDVTADIAASVAHALHRHTQETGEPPMAALRDFVEHQCGVATVLPAVRFDTEAA